MEIITSRANNAIKNAKKLQQKKYRKTSYLIEGWHLFEEAVAANANIEKIFVIPEQADKVRDYPQAVQVTAELLKDLAESPSPQGVVAVIALPNQQMPEVLTGRFLVLEDVQDPGNVGTMIRTADAAGFDGVIVSEKTADIYNLKTLRSMQGSHFHLPIYQVDTAEALSRLKACQIPLVATTLSEHSIDYREVPKTANVALIMGNEGQGISDLVAQEADILAHITMPGRAESLNVAVATGILLFHIV
ncbi:TrmH family RNA methyltransferase [Streptococcus moroccensis]|uniref:TrmH family RNA methyltransferase n=1 Tax=Streptococcus moroccensis TaxID=1451356 RepID=A0ABT9YQG4_9STRE|nr:RNA methyltransferase [Streptococcus moroccensis]MDQ0222235.1 TrmH family RNA methyltransferase [Streptococcus moroccensis]